MKLLRIRLRSFRGVHDREVHPAEHGVTVLEGDNEVGKTSTLQALDMLVDDPDSSSKAHVRAAAPTHADAGPEVEADIATGPYRFTYRKRWRRRPITELTVHAPRAEQLTGRPAHDRVLAILDETVDRGLWKALRVEQRTPLGQAELDGHAALSRALDRAAGGSPDEAAGPDPGDDLVALAEREVRRYRTVQGRATGELRDAEQRLDAARAEHDRAVAAVAAVEADAAERDRLDERLRGLGTEHRAHVALVTELEEAWSALQSRAGEVDAARERAAVGRERAAAATARRAERGTLAEAAADAARDAAAADRAAAEHERRHAGLREHRDARRSERDAARDAATSTAADARRADDALAAAHDAAELADLTARLERVAEAEAGVRAAERAIAACPVTDADVTRLEGLALDVVRAEAARDAAAAVLEVSVPASAPDLAVTLDGEDVTLTGTPRTVPVSRAVGLRVPGVLDVHVRPGTDARALADTATDAADALAAACAELGVADAARARAAREAAREATHRRDDHRATLARELAGRDADAMRAARTALVERRGESGTGEDGDGEDGDGEDGPPDLDVARTDAADARATADAAGRLAEAADAAWRAADDATRAADTEAAVLAKGLVDARHAEERAATELEGARRSTPDADLATAEDTARAASRAAAAEHERLAAALAGDDPTSVEERVDNARAVARRLTEETAGLERARAETTGRLQLAGSEGRHDRLVAAADERTAAEADHTATERRARAATLLHDTLRRHRDEVRRAYVAPFRRELERLARIVFGPGVALEVDERLRIVSRTLHGVTVGFDDLSAGAKEQLGLCARLAGAALVDPADGVPVIIDDALGHCDADRLARLGAVFSAATSGAGHQVLVLTCSPERYRHVGSAHVVRLAHSRTPLSPPSPGQQQRDGGEHQPVGHPPPAVEPVEDHPVDGRSRHPQPGDERAVG